MQVTVLRPDGADVRRLQDAEGRYGFSHLAGALLRKHGVVPADEGRFAVIPRGGARLLDGPCLAEGPFEEGALGALGLTAEHARAESLELRGTRGRLGALAY